MVELFVPSTASLSKIEDLRCCVLSTFACTSSLCNTSSSHLLTHRKCFPHHANEDYPHNHQICPTHSASVSLDSADGAGQEDQEPVIVSVFWFVCLFFAFVWLDSTRQALSYWNRERFGFLGSCAFTDDLSPLSCVQILPYHKVKTLLGGGDQMVTIATELFMATPETIQYLKEIYIINEPAEGRLYMYIYVAVHKFSDYFACNVFILSEQCRSQL